MLQDPLWGAWNMPRKTETMKGKRFLLMMMCTVCAMVQFSSCDNDNGNDKVKVPDGDNLDYLLKNGHKAEYSGYFNGKYVKYSEEGVHNPDTHWYINGTLGCGYNHYGCELRMPFQNGDSLYMKVSPISVGIWNLTHYDYELNRTGGNHELKIENRTAGTSYAVKGYRTELCIDRVITLDADMKLPIVQGRLDGCLYNEKDPSDSIILKDVKFRF